MSENYRSLNELVLAFIRSQETPIQPCNRAINCTRPTGKFYYFCTNMSVNTFWREIRIQFWPQTLQKTSQTLPAPLRSLQEINKWGTLTSASYHFMRSWWNPKWWTHSGGAWSITLVLKGRFLLVCITSSHLIFFLMKKKHTIHACTSSFKRRGTSNVEIPGPYGRGAINFLKNKM